MSEPTQPTEAACGRSDSTEVLDAKVAEIQGFLKEAYAEIARLNNVIQQPPLGADLPQPVLCESCKAIGAAYKIGVEKNMAANVEGKGRAACGASQRPKGAP